MQKINFHEVIDSIKEPWEPKDIAHVGNAALRVAMIHGVFDWHAHRQEDELFFVLKGKIYIDTEKETIELNEMEGFLVKKGIRHRSRSDAPAWVLLFEPKKTKTKGE
ncbi:MAG: cupin domain-containing protein [Candidatus Aminicenantes bacterium]|nr:cupin domain-containing protein [Candidatus Aminicenantes bacterium]